jgi:hypothetical protein
MRSRKPPGGRKPINTLNRTSPGSNPLTTVASRGQNVSSGSIKRQKISHVFPDDIEDDGFFNRGLQGQASASLTRQPSVSAISTHSQEALSQRSDPFGHNEARDMHRVLNATKKAGRKPKSGPTQHSSPPLYGAITDPVPVDDDDDIRLLGEDNNTPRLAQHRAVQWSPSPALHGTFIRDNEEPDLVPGTRENQSKIRNKMQSASNTTRARQLPQVVEDLSDDELLGNPTVQSSAQKTKKIVKIRSPSPNDIKSTYFTSNRNKQGNPVIALRLLRMMAGRWENHLHLIYSRADKFMQITKNGKILCDKGATIQISSKHATDAYYSRDSSRKVILTGCKGDFTRGRIWFECETDEDRDTFLDAIKDMSPKVRLKDLNE